MDIVIMIHIAITIVALITILVIFTRLSGTGYYEEEQRSVAYELKSQQISSQLVILARYVRKLIASWEYLLLLITFITMASILSHPLDSRGSFSEEPVSINMSLARDVFILYSPSGLNITGDLRGSVIAAIYMGTLGEPAVIEAGQRIFRAFNVIIIECSPRAGSADLGSGFREILTSLCRFGEGEDIYLIAGRPGSNASYGGAKLYYEEERLEIKIKTYEESLVESLKKIPCIDRDISSYIRSMDYSGGLIAPERFLGIFGIHEPNVAIIANSSLAGNIEELGKTGAEIICRGSLEPGKAVVYIASQRSLTQQLLDIAIAGLAGGVILIIFNRSVIPRIAPGSEAILISGGTYWISRILPLISIAVAEIFSISVLALSYSMNLSLRAGGEPFISPPGILLLSLISLAVSLAHMMRVKTAYSPLSSIYVEKTIPARGYSYVIEDLSYQETARLVAKALETSEFFSVLEKEIMEKEGLANLRLRLLYRYSIGVGADVNIYISKHNGRGSFIDVDIEPWSVDASKGGILDSVARMILSRISGAIAIGKISKDRG